MIVILTNSRYAQVMKRWSSVGFLFMFLWLQTYQLCDASEDVIEALPIATQMLSGHRVILRAPVPPEDDDAAGPSVFDQTLTQGDPQAGTRGIVFYSKAAPQPTISIPMAKANVQGLSSPNDRSPWAIGFSNDVFVPANGSLAPPLA